MELINSFSIAWRGHMGYKREFEEQGARQDKMEVYISPY